MSLRVLSYFLNFLIVEDVGMAQKQERDVTQ